jgi:hypothetical protein
MGIQQRIQRTDQAADRGGRSREAARRDEDQREVPPSADDGRTLELHEVCDVFGHQRTTLRGGVGQQGRMHITRR